MGGLGSDWFLKIKDSYDTLKNYLQSRPEVPAPKAAPHGRIIAVAGAKGGVGKSTFAANLGIFLASRSYRTTLLDLDGYGAKLHLYLGEIMVPSSVNDFLSRPSAQLEDVAVPTRFGPTLLGGDSSRLRSATIGFLDKLRLIEALRSLDAQRVVIDLGSDTSANLMDFFLMADSSLIVTTPEPAAFLEAYNFIKLSVFRQISRALDALSPTLGPDQTLEDLVDEAATSGNGGQAQTVAQLLERLHHRRPQALPIVRQTLAAYRPFLFLNQAEENGQSNRIVRRIQEVARTNLSLEVRYLGSLPFLEEITRSNRELYPALAREPHGPLAHRFSRLAALL